LSEGFAAFAPQFLNLIQRRRDPSLLHYGWEQKVKVFEEVRRDTTLSCAPSHLPLTIVPNSVLSQIVEQVTTV